jgi:hypothetical protein
MPFASPEKNRAYMKDYMRKRRAKLPKKTRVYAAPKPKPVDTSTVLCAHCQRYIPLREWGKEDHRPPPPEEPATPSDSQS